MHHRLMIVAGGLSFVIGALAFVAAFSYLAANFNYPGVVRGVLGDTFWRELGTTPMAQASAQGVRIRRLLEHSAEFNQTSLICGKRHRAR
jgi:hypothetical protein